MNALDKIKNAVRQLETYSVKGNVLTPSLIKLNQNENPFDLPETLKKELLDEFFRQSWNRYPDVFAAELVRSLSKYTQHPVDGIIAGNGSNELMYTVLLSVVSQGTKVLIPVPTFFLYEKVVHLMEGIVVPVPMNNDLSFDVEAIVEKAKEENPALIVLVSPNSPTGQSVAVTGVERILRETSAIVLVDEAYIDFSEKRSVQSLLSTAERLVILRTFSKSFSMAGLRIGYLMAQPAVAAELLKPKIPFTVNNFSASVAVGLMKRRSLIAERIEYIKREKKILLEAMKAIEGVEVFSSDSNFLIFRTPLNADVLFGKLLLDKVLVRDVSSYPMLIRTLRVNVGTKEENHAFLASLKKNVSQTRDSI